MSQDLLTSQDWPLTPEAWKALEEAGTRAGDPVAPAALAALRRQFPPAVEDEGQGLDKDWGPGWTEDWTEGWAASPSDDSAPVADAPSLAADPDLDQDMGRSGSVLLSEPPEEAYLAYEIDEDAPAWQVVGNAGEIARATRDMGLDANALRPADLESEAMVVHPSSFCENGAIFLGILALLNQRAVPFRLYRSLKRSEGSDQYMVRMFPEPGLETRDVLRAFHPGVARHVSELQERIHWAFEHLARSIPDERT
jgi:hypothetical protein